MRVVLTLLVLSGAGCRHDLPSVDARRSDLADGPRAPELRADQRFERDVRPDAQPPDAASPPLVTWSEGQGCASGQAVGWGIDCQSVWAEILAVGPPTPSDCSQAAGAIVRYVGCASGSISTGDTCVSSEQLIGGQCVCGSSNAIKTSAPLATEWSCACSTFFGKPSAHCVLKSAVSDLTFTPRLNEQQDSTNVVVECDPGETLVAGGCESTSGLQASVPFWNGTRWSGWRCLAPSQTLTAKVLCVK